MALADATIYVPTQRAAQALAKALLSASGARSLVLPRIAPLGAFEPDETATVFDPEDDEARARGCSARGRRALAPPCAGDPHPRLGKGAQGRDPPGGRRRRLVVDPAEPALVAATPAQAYALAGDLAALIDDMIIEGAPWTKLETLAPELYDPYWRITLDFLKIAVAGWPEWLASAASSTGRSGSRCSSTKKSRRSIARVAVPPSSPDRPAPIARPPASSRPSPARQRARSCLPGLDLDLDDRAWAMIGASDGASGGLAGHPQALLQSADRRNRRQARGRQAASARPPLSLRLARLS